MSPRPYRLGERQATIDETRESIIVAAKTLLAGRQGAAAFTMDAIARKAGVARMTVYHQFGSKRGLLEALFDHLGSRGLVPHLPAAFAQPSPREALAQIVAAFGHFWDSDRIVLRRIRSLAGLDADFEEGVRARDERRRMGLRMILGRLSEGTGSPTPERIEEFVNVIHALTSFETFDALAGENGRPKDVVPLVNQLVNSVLDRGLG